MFTVAVTQHLCIGKPQTWRWFSCLLSHAQVAGSVVAHPWSDSFCRHSSCCVSVAEKSSPVFVTFLSSGLGPTLTTSRRRNLLGTSSIISSIMFFTELDFLSSYTIRPWRIPVLQLTQRALVLSALDHSELLSGETSKEIGLTFELLIFGTPSPRITFWRISQKHAEMWCPEGVCQQRLGWSRFSNRSWLSCNSDWGYAEGTKDTWTVDHRHFVTHISCNGFSLHTRRPTVSRPGSNYPRIDHDWRIPQKRSLSTSWTRDASSATQCLHERRELTCAEYKLMILTNLDPLISGHGLSFVSPVTQNDSSYGTVTFLFLSVSLIRFTYFRIIRILDAFSRLLLLNVLDGTQ